MGSEMCIRDSDEAAVEVYFGVLESTGNIQGGEIISLDHAKDMGNGLHLFKGLIECRFCGRYGFMLRVMPKHKVLGNIYEPGYLVWG